MPRRFVLLAVEMKVGKMIRARYIIVTGVDRNLGKSNQ